MPGPDRCRTAPLALAALAVGCGSLSTYRTAEPIGPGRWQIDVAADVGAFTDRVQDTRTPAAHLEVAVRRGLGPEDIPGPPGRVWLRITGHGDGPGEALGEAGHAVGNGRRDQRGDPLGREERHRPQRRALADQRVRGEREVRPVRLDRARRHQRDAHGLSQGMSPRWGSPP